MFFLSVISCSIPPRGPGFGRGYTCSLAGKRNELIRTKRETCRFTPQKTRPTGRSHGKSRRVSQKTDPRKNTARGRNRPTRGRFRLWETAMGNRSTSRNPMGNRGLVSALSRNAKIRRVYRSITHAPQRNTRTFARRSHVHACGTHGTCACSHSPLLPPQPQQPPTPAALPPPPPRPAPRRRSRPSGGRAVLASRVSDRGGGRAAANASEAGGGGRGGRGGRGAVCGGEERARRDDVVPRVRQVCGLRGRHALLVHLCRRRALGLRDGVVLRLRRHRRGPRPGPSACASACTSSMCLGSCASGRVSAGGSGRGGVAHQRGAGGGEGEWCGAEVRAATTASPA